MGFNKKNKKKLGNENKTANVKRFFYNKFICPVRLDKTNNYLIIHLWLQLSKN